MGIQKRKSTFLWMIAIVILLIIIYLIWKYYDLKIATLDQNVEHGFMFSSSLLYKTLFR